MITIENTKVVGLEAAIRGMRNPMNSWNKSDSSFKDDDGDYHNIMGEDYGLDSPDHFILGQQDMKLMLKLRNAGTDHRKFMRMIVVYLDITAPLYWWKEFDTYKVGTVANSCSTMHKLTSKPFTLNDFSCEHLIELPNSKIGWVNEYPIHILNSIIDCLNQCRDNYLASADMSERERKLLWWQMIQLLPSSYNQKRTVMLNYEVLSNMYKSRRWHKLDEWRDFCDWIAQLPYAEELIGASDVAAALEKAVQEYAKNDKENMDNMLKGLSPMMKGENDG